MLLAVVCVVSFSAFAQETTGTIEGTVRDPNGAVVPGVVVTVTSVGTTVGARQDATAGFTRSITANNQGFYRMQADPAWILPGFDGSNRRFRRSYGQ